MRAVLILFSMRSINEGFYKTARWRACRDAYLQTQDYLCERCRMQGHRVPAVIVHHKIYLNRQNIKDPAVAYGFKNLEALCLDCHNKEHFTGEEQAPRRWKIDKKTGKVTGADIIPPHV